jgi:hypothetical protein
VVGLLTEGTICKVTVKENESNFKESVYVILRGVEEELDNKDIFIDESLRKKLGVKSGEEYDFYFTDCSWFGWLPWMLNTTDVGYKIASRIAIISLVISLPGLFSLIQSLVNFILNIFC